MCVESALKNNITFALKVLIRARLRGHLSIRSITLKNTDDKITASAYIMQLSSITSAVYQILCHRSPHLELVDAGIQAVGGGVELTRFG